MSTENKIDSVAIVAMGSSKQGFIDLSSHSGSMHKIAEQVWAINSMGGVIQHDLLFHMDDCKVQESRAERSPDGNIAGMLTWLKDHPKFITSKAYPDYKGAFEFPLQAVIRKLGIVYFNNTVAYALAYAIYLDVKKIFLFGCDFSYPDIHKAERGRGCVEMLCGYALAKGIIICIDQKSTLMDANLPDEYRLYGYDADTILIENDEAGNAVVTKTPKDLPSAEEIEIRYNHEPKS